MRLRSVHFIRIVRRRLGQDRGHGIVVELSDGQIISSLRSAISRFSHYHPKKRYQSIQAGPGTTRYKPDQEVRGIELVEVVDRPDDISIFESPTDGVVWNPLYFGAGQLPYETPAQLATFVEWKRASAQVFGTEIVWFWDDGDRTLYISSPERILVGITETIDYDPGFDENDDWDTPTPGDMEPATEVSSRLDKTLSEVDDYWQDKIEDLCVAASMQILGRMRRKYSSIPAAEGREISMDGSDLVREGEELWKETDEELRRTAIGYEPIIG